MPRKIEEFLKFHPGGAFSAPPNKEERNNFQVTQERALGSYLSKLRHAIDKTWPTQ